MERVYFREYFKEYYARRKSEYIALLGGKCARCGSTENLEFDHIDPKIKSFNITNFLNFSRAKVLEELKKCQLLCYICHKKKTNKPREHGTTTMYRRGCRCGMCSGANTESMRRWKLRKVGH
jgi:5-methylcytosine-specific restriction endonuclease McrA